MDPASTMADQGAMPFEGLIQRIARILASISIIGILGLVSTELLTRNVFNVSFPAILELSGYCLVASFFLSIGACFAVDGFHRVELLRDRLEPRKRLMIDAVFNIVALLACLILLWYLARFEWLTWTRGEVSPAVQTPLYIPRAVMPIGLAILCLAIFTDTYRKFNRIIGRDPKSVETVHDA